MPLIGLALGAPVARAIGGTADHAAGAALIALGPWMLVFQTRRARSRPPGAWPRRPGRRCWGSRYVISLHAEGQLVQRSAVFQVCDVPSSARSEGPDRRERGAGDVGERISVVARQSVGAIREHAVDRGRQEERTDQGQPIQPIRRNTTEEVMACQYCAPRPDCEEAQTPGGAERPRRCVNAQ
jgi:hypothetical protein